MEYSGQYQSAQFPMENLQPEGEVPMLDIRLALQTILINSTCITATQNETLIWFTFNSVIEYSG